MIVKCPAETCIHCKKGICTSESIEMVDFEYYMSAENKTHEILDDEIKCNSYESLFKANRD